MAPDNLVVLNGKINDEKNIIRSKHFTIAYRLLARRFRSHARSTTNHEIGTQHVPRGSENHLREIIKFSLLYSAT